MSRPDFDRMTPEEVAAYFDAAEEQSRAMYAGAPPLRRFNRAKWVDDYPHFRFVGYGFQLRPGFLIVCDTPQGRLRGQTLGLRPQSPDTGWALVVTMGHRTWALTRADSKPWAESPNARRATVPERWVPVNAWATDPDAQSVTAPDCVERWTVFTPFLSNSEDAEWFATDVTERTSEDDRPS
jgi:hypothetical protein